MRRSEEARSNVRSTALQERVARAENEGLLTSTRRDLLRAILDNSDETYFLSSRELARRYSVEPSTIVRAVQTLGYKRFAEFSADLRKHFVTRITPYRVMKTATEQQRTPADHVVYSLEKDVQNVTQLRSRLDVEQVLRAARQIRRARRVLIVGIDFAASLAWTMDYGLSIIGVHAEAPIGTTGNLLHKLRALTPKDLLIAISFGRCLRETVNAVHECHARGVPTLGITDSELSPIAKYCDSYLTATVASPSIAASYAAAMALVNCILTACAHISPKRSLRVLRQGEIDSYDSERWYNDDEWRNGKK
jgi:DNA-binding MurR/RpiR family transcriptional regulator